MLILVCHIDKLGLKFQIFFHKGCLLPLLLSLIITVLKMLPNGLLLPHFIDFESEILDLLVFELQLLVERPILAFVLI